MKKFFLIPLLACFSCVMAFAVEVSTLQQLKDAVAAGGDITLADDIDGGTNPTVTIASGKTVNLDLNDHRFYASVTANGGLITNKGNLTVFDSGSNGTLENTNQNAGSFIRFITSSGTLWIKKGKVIAQSKMCLNAEDNSTMIIGTEGGSNDDVLIESKRLSSSQPTYYDGNSNSAVAITTRLNSTLIIYCGTIKSNSHYALFFADKASVNIYNGVFAKGPEVPSWFGNAGSFVNSDLVVYGGTYPSNPLKYLSQDSYTLKEVDVYNVYPMTNKKVSTVYTIDDIKNQLASASTTQAVYMTLGADVVINEKIELLHASQLTIPAGRTLTIQNGGLFVNDGRTINNGTISIVGNGFFSKPASVEGEGSIVISGYVINESAGVVNYVVSNAMQLQYLAYLVLQDAYEDKTWNISLTTDIYMPTEANFETIRRISGTFDGQKYSINNFTANSPLFAIFQGHMKNVTFNNATIIDGGAVLCEHIDHNSIFENVTLNGTSSAVAETVAGFITTTENIKSAGRSYGMQNADNYLWFVNCVNNVDVSTTGFIAGGFIGTMSGAKGTIGFYNCVNNGNVSAKYAGALVGYGYGANLDVIAFTNTGTITGPSNHATKWKVGGVNYVGNDNKSHSITYLDPTQYTAVYDETLGKYVAKQQGILDNKGNTPTTDWAQNTTWTSTDDETYVVPNAADNVTVNNDDGVVVTTTDAVAKQVTVNTSLTVKDGATLTVGKDGLTIANTATVTVEQGATLVIGEAGLTNNGKLEVKGTLTKGTGVVLFDPAADAANTRVQAEVSITPDAHKKGENSLLYRYIGIPLYFEGSEVFVKATNWAVSDPTATIYFKEWNPLTGWDNLNAWADLVPFKGYATSNSTVNNLTYTFKGNLVGNANQTLNFAYGFNMYANSYTAPIQIQTLLNSFDENVNATIYMFDDGVVKSVSKSAFNGYEDPEFTSIPSLQAFFVLMENEGMTPTENINYANTVYNFHGMNDAFYAPARHETPDFNRVRINVANENGANDAVYMIEAADFTNEFDNGYDAVKYMNTGLNLFATTAHGRQSSNYSNSIEGSFIGVQGNGTYTMSFDKLAGEEYQIRDLENDAVITMSENNTYTFTVNGTNEARFVVETIAKMPTAIDNVNAANMFVRDNTLYVGANNADIQIFAANGQLVLADKAKATVDLSGLATGVYTVRVANQSLKFVK